MLSSLILSLVLDANAASCPWAGLNKPTVSTSKHEVFVNGTSYRVKSETEMEAFEDNLSACNVNEAGRYLRRWRGRQSTAGTYAWAGPVQVVAGLVFLADTSTETFGWVFLGLGAVESIAAPVLRGQGVQARDTMVAKIAASTPPTK
ncbi:MAG: hypothetical protein RLZZ299_2224 [Pseudomonadota bacterium]|jgi:hypothetical protein